jgi:hypothetical protein
MIFENIRLKTDYWRWEKIKFEWAKGGKNRFS